MLWQHPRNKRMNQNFEQGIDVNDWFDFMVKGLEAYVCDKSTYE